MLDLPADPRTNRTRTPRSATRDSPSLATAIVLVAVMVAVAIIVRNVRDRSGRGQAAGTVRRPHSVSPRWTRTSCSAGSKVARHRLVPPGSWSPGSGRTSSEGAAAAGMDEPEPPRVQLIRDASAVGIAIIVVLLIGPTIFASRTGAVLGETSPPDGCGLPVRRARTVPER